jgi:hypothetical protein
MRMTSNVLGRNIRTTMKARFCSIEYGVLGWKDVYCVQTPTIRTKTMLPSSGSKRHAASQAVCFHWLLAWLTLRPWRWRHSAPPKLLDGSNYTELQPRRTACCSFTAVRTWIQQFYTRCLAFYSRPQCLPCLLLFGISVTVTHHFFFV